MKPDCDRILLETSMCDRKNRYSVLLSRVFICELYKQAKTL